MKIRCLIIDDEPLAISVIKNYLEPLEDFELIETFNNPLNALNFLKNNAIDVIFLDINMPVLNGISFIQSLEKRPLIIITSAYDEYAIETYALDVLDYLVKPIEFPRLMKALNKANKTLRSQHLNVTPNKDRAFLFIKIDKKKLQKIYLDEILTIESLKDYLRINTQTGKYIVHSTLSEFTASLPSKNFIRIHRSYTVAIDKVEAIEGNTVEIEGIRFTIGRSYVAEAKEKILNTSA